MFSVVLIAKNEEKTLPRLLNSLQSVDEIILLDTGSTDGTYALAIKSGCKAYSVGDRFVKVVDNDMAEATGLNIGDKAFDFAEARNYASSLAKNDMIFMPDCDEYVEWDLDEVNKIKADRLEYNFYYAMDDNDKPIIQFIHSKFYNRTKYKWTRMVHEVLQGEGQTVFTDKILLKHRQNTETNRKQYLTGLAMDNYLNEYNDRNTHYYGRELMYNGQYEKAIEILKKHIENKGWDIEQGQSYIYIGDCYRKLGDDKKAIENYWLSMSKSIRREPIISIADMYYEQKNWLNAAVLYELCLSVPRNNYYGNFEKNYTHIPHGQLSVCLYWLNEKEKSLYHLKKALEYEPNNKTYIENLKFY